MFREFQPAEHLIMASSCVDRLHISASRSPKTGAAAAATTSCSCSELSFQVHLSRTLQVLPQSQSHSPDEPLLTRTQPVQVMAFPSVGCCCHDLLLPRKFESVLKAMPSYFNLPHHLLLPFKYHILYLANTMNDHNHDLTLVLRMDVTTRKRIATDDQATMLRLKDNGGGTSPEAAAALIASLKKIKC